ncbi:MAG TPA: hypothetical protein VIY08_12320 [Candidatus Nitrosocosmicus sp.]
MKRWSTMTISNLRLIILLDCVKMYFHSFYRQTEGIEQGYANEKVSSSHILL